MEVKNEEKQSEKAPETIQLDQYEWLVSFEKQFD